MKHYTFIVYLSAEGENEQEAWDEAVSAFALEPGEPEVFSEEDIDD